LSLIAAPSRASFFTVVGDGRNKLFDFLNATLQALSALLHLEPQEGSFGAAQGLRIVAFLLVELVAAFI
jgi:hypothetical protein